MCSFTYEEQGDKRYLVYEKNADDRMDILALEMMSNNRIKGLVPVNHTQIDDCFCMKYDITGLECLREIFQKPVNRNRFFAILESILDGAMMAEEYMLPISSYVLNPDYMYVDSSARKVYMVALPIQRSEAPLERFLKQLLLDIQYDSTEDCSYVAILSNLLGSLKPFSAGALKEQIAYLKKKEGKGGKQEETNVGVHAAVQPQQISLSSQAPYGQQPVSESQPQGNGFLQKIQPQGTKGQAGDKAKPGILGRKRALDAEKQRCFDILFSDEDEGASKKEKKGLFFKRDKSEKSEKTEIEEDGKKEKKGFWKKKKKEPGTIPEMEALLGGIQIPGVDTPVRKQAEVRPETGGNRTNGEYPRYDDVAIPIQKVEMDRVSVEMEYAGETVYLGTEEDETIYLEENAAPKFVLVRCSTNETFLIKGTGVRIGRSPATTEICIKGNQGIGRVHAILHVQDGEVFIEDNHSKNYTYVNGERLTPENPPCRLEPGSRIRLGNEEFEFRIQE